MLEVGALLGQKGFIRARRHFISHALVLGINFMLEVWALLGQEGLSSLLLSC